MCKEFLLECFADASTQVMLEGLFAAVITARAWPDLATCVA